jgi:hypothetical protein
MKQLKDVSGESSKKSIRKGLWSAFAIVFFGSIYGLSPTFAAGAFIPLIVCVFLSQFFAQYLINIQGQFKNPYLVGLGINFAISIVVLTLIFNLLPGIIRL